MSKIPFYDLDHETARFLGGPAGSTSSVIPRRGTRYITCPEIVFPPLSRVISETDDISVPLPAIIYHEYRRVAETDIFVYEGE